MHRAAVWLARTTPRDLLWVTHWRHRGSQASGERRPEPTQILAAADKELGVNLAPTICVTAERLPRCGAAGATPLLNHLDVLVRGSHAQMMFAAARNLLPTHRRVRTRAYLTEGGLNFFPRRCASQGTARAGLAHPSTPPRLRCSCGGFRATIVAPD